MLPRTLPPFTLHAYIQSLVADKIVAFLALHHVEVPVIIVGALISC
jgi:hypothetical protein